MDRPEAAEFAPKEKAVGAPRRGAGWQAALDAERMRIATRTLPVLVMAGMVFTAFFIGVYFLLGRPWQWTWMILEITQAPVLMLVAYSLARRGHLAATVYLTVFAINVTAIIGPALVEGMIIPGIMAGVVSTMFARLLAGPTENRIASLISGAAMAIGITLYGFRVFDILPIPAWVQVATGLAGIIVMGLLVVMVLDSRDRQYETSLAQAEAYATELSAHRATLEERTRALERRTSYLEATSAVARDATSVLDAQRLLSRVTKMISEQFGFYHTGIFLLDPTGEWAVLEAASSEGGLRMLERRHRLKVGEVGIVGYVTGRGEPRIALDVGADAVFFDNPDLPETRSEMALPLRARGYRGEPRIIGALDVQSTEPGAFSEEDASVLQTLADQVAMAINNARLFEQAQASLDAERRAYGEVSRQAWAEMMRSRPNQGYRYDRAGVTPVGTTPAEGDGTLPEFALPVKVRGQVVAALEAHKHSDSGDWSPDEVTLLELLTDQLGVALESARLYQDTQHRAVEEQLIGEITSRMRATLDLETVLQTATDEIYHALGLDRIMVRLGTSPATRGAGETDNGL